MNITEAIDALRPFTSKVPSEALNYVRAHWNEAEAILLAEMGKTLETLCNMQRTALTTT